MATPETLVPLGIAPHLRPLPSAGITRLHRYFGPLRHPAGPTLALAGLSVGACHAHRSGLPVLRPFPSSMRAAATTPAEPVGACVARFPTDGSLPRFHGGSASALRVSGPARRSLVVAARMVAKPPLAARCIGVLQTMSLPPIIRSRLLPAGATVAGRDSHPLKNGAFHGAREMTL